MRIRALAFTALTVAALGSVVLATPAQAAEKPRHCVASVTAPKAPAACFDSFTAAIANATGGRVTDAPDSLSAALKDPTTTEKLNVTREKTDGASIAADIVISIEWESDDFSGSTLTYTAPWGCTGTISDTDWEVPGLPGGWNDEIGSYKGFANCWVKHYEHDWFGGISTAYDGGRADMGWMDDESSSIRWS